MAKAAPTIPPGVTCAIAVEASWRYSGAINAMLGPPDVPTASPSPTSSLLVAKVLSVDDSIGLWIELNSERKRFPHLPVLRLVIPWSYVLGICVDPADSDTPKNWGLPQAGPADITTVAAPAVQS